MLIENRVQVLAIGRSGLKLRLEPSIGVVQSFRVVIPLPKLNRPHVREQEYSRAHERHQRRAEQTRQNGLEQQQRSMRRRQWLSERMKRRAPGQLPRRRVNVNKLEFVHEIA